MRTGDSLDGRYTIVSRLGEGGMGEVYQATHDHLGATRVIKIVRPQISGSDDARSRFIREARAAIKVTHPNVATLHDFATLPDGAHYMVWEYIEGENLAQRLRSHGTLPPREAVAIIIQALRGLEAIHRAGIVHRDISPENLMVTPEGEVKIIDLGVAKVDDPSAVAETRTGIFVGKLRYASPEQLGFLEEGEKIDGRTDIYAVGMVLVELLTGRPPYEAKSPHEYFRLHAREEHSRSVELPLNLPGGEALRDIASRALARSRTERFATAREFADALESIAPALADPDATTVTVPRSGPDEVTVRTTQRSGVGETGRTRAAAPTVIDPHPAPPPRRARVPFVVAGIVAAAIVLIGAFMISRQFANGSGTGDAAAPPSSTGPSAAALTTVAASTAGSTVTVTTKNDAADLATASTAPPASADTGRPASTAMTEARRKPTSPRGEAATTETRAAETSRGPAPAEEPRATADAALPLYVDGGPNEEANDHALAALRQQLKGTREVTLHAGGMHDALVAALKDELPDLRVTPSATVVVQFEGVLERMRLGRKRRAAEATILKNDRPIFRYVLPDEVFRVGMTPAEAFARILASAAE